MYFYAICYMYCNICTAVYTTEYTLLCTTVRAVCTVWCPLCTCAVFLLHDLSAEYATVVLCCPALWSHQEHRIPLLTIVSISILLPDINLIMFSTRTLARKVTTTAVRNYKVAVVGASGGIGGRIHTCSHITLMIYIYIYRPASFSPPQTRPPCDSAIAVWCC